MTTQITRVTVIKIPEDKIDIALQGFEIFTKNQKKDGKPYILSMSAGPATSGHVREEGYTFVTKSVFRNKKGMDFYEKECLGHMEYKVFLRERAPIPEGGLMTICFVEGVCYVG